MRVVGEVHDVGTAASARVISKKFFDAIERCNAQAATDQGGGSGRAPDLDPLGKAGVGGGGRQDRAGRAVADADEGAGVVFDLHTMGGRGDDKRGFDRADVDERAK